jgi:ABC-type amino acid transport substrate-binding protein
MKLLDVGVADIVMQIADGSVPAGNFFGQAALADFHDLVDLVPDDVKAELETVRTGLLDGSISTGYGVAEEPAEEPVTEPGAADFGVVKIGVNAEYSPMEFVDENGDIVGFDVDLVNELASRAGFEVEWINTRWDGIFVALASGEFDVVASSATITDEREIVDFSILFLRQPADRRA